MISVIDWETTKEEFFLQIEHTIDLCIQNDKSMPLPIPVIPGDATLGMLALLNTAINCRNCTALCCRQAMEKNDLGIGLLPTEAIYFSSCGCKINNIQGELHTPYPCLFNSGEMCRIYENRPLSCRFFPFQPGGQMGPKAEYDVYSISVRCPEGKRIAREVYLTCYELKTAMKSVLKNGLPRKEV